MYMGIRGRECEYKRQGSGPGAQALVVPDGDVLPHMPKVVVVNFLGVDVVHSDVHVQAGLDVVLGHA